MAGSPIRNATLLASGLAESSTLNTSISRTEIGTIVSIDFLVTNRNKEDMRKLFNRAGTNIDISIIVSNLDEYPILSKEMHMSRATIDIGISDTILSIELVDLESGI